MKSQSKEFLAEAEELLAVMERDIMSLTRGVNADVVDHSVINKIFRSVHTLKGLSSIFDFNDITELSHALEDSLDMLRLGRIVLDEKCLRSITLAHGLLSKIVSKRAFTGFSDEVQALISSLQSGDKMVMPTLETPLEDNIISSLTEYERFRLGDNLQSGKRLFMVSASFDTSSFDMEHSAFTSLLKKVSEIIATLPSEGAKGGNLGVDTLIASSESLEEIESFLGGKGGATLRELPCNGSCESKEAQPPSLAGEEPSLRDISYTESMRRNARTIRVDVEKIETLMSCVDELCSLREPFSRLMDGIGEEKTNPARCSGMDRLTARIEDSFERMRECVLAIKMVRIERLFKRFEPYIVRLAHECGKEVRITTYGGDTELDMTIIEEIADPLMHIIRNVIDHGIESPSKRAACGKSKAGAVTLSAYYEGEKVVIEVKDDGGGIDGDLICGRAVSKGFINKAEAGDLGRQEKLNLIFLPGFTTEDEISLTSGRGVGLDVVRENIALLNGLVEIETVLGKGTRFILTIPVTQVMKGLLMCEDDGKTFAVSGTRVEEVVELRDGASIIDGYLMINKGRIRAIRPSQLFHSHTSSSEDSSYAIVTSVGPVRLCLIVDKVLAENNMIIRPLPFEHKIRGILGLSEALNNVAVLVLDIAGILELLSADARDPSPEKHIV